ncbi:MAG: M48 family metalloprotease [Desulfatitalea sp.]
MEMVYKNEKPLFILALIISLTFWFFLVVGTVGIALFYALIFYVAYLFAQSGFISHIKGTGVKVSTTQYPDLHERLMACCKKIGLDQTPDCYVLRTDVFNALATRFRGRHFIVLFSDVVDTLKEDPEALNFYIGHEIGHIHRKHLTWGVWLAPAKILPLLGAAYSRACEYTCDRYGLACCESPVAAQRGLVAIGAGSTRFATTNIDGYIGQSAETNGFWMSFHELCGGYPWLVKRAAAVKMLAEGKEPLHPGRNPIAWMFACCVPNAGVGGAGSLIIVAAIIGILAAVAVPIYTQYQQRAMFGAAMEQTEEEMLGDSDEAAEAEAGLEEAENDENYSTQMALVALEVATVRGVVQEFFAANKRLPASTAELSEALPGGSTSELSTVTLQKSGYVSIAFSAGELNGRSLLLVPTVEAEALSWTCQSESFDEVELSVVCADE